MKRSAGLSGRPPASGATERKAAVQGSGGSQRERDRLRANFVRLLTRHLEVAGPDKEETRLLYLAQAAGCSRQAAWRWFSRKGVGLPDLVTFRRVAQRMGLDANALLGIYKAPQAKRAASAAPKRQQRKGTDRK